MVESKVKHHWKSKLTQPKWNKRDEGQEKVNFRRKSKISGNWSFLGKWQTFRESLYNRK
jgi:hypothetical protein